MRGWLCTVLAALGLAVPTGLSADSDVIDARQHPEVISVGIEPDRLIYHAGDDVKIRVWLHNNTSQGVILTFFTPWTDILLQVKGAHRGQAPAIIPARPECACRLVVWKINPGATVLETQYACCGVSDEERADGFVSSKAWGYWFTHPGTYGFAAWRRFDENTTSSISNVVTFDVRP